MLLMQKQAKLQYSVNTLGHKIGLRGAAAGAAPAGGQLPPAPAPAASTPWATTSGALVEARGQAAAIARRRPARRRRPTPPRAMAAARQREVVRAHERLGERTAWIEALLGDGEAADAVAPSDAGRSAAELAASAAAAEAAAL